MDPTGLKTDENGDLKLLPMLEIRISPDDQCLMLQSLYLVRLKGQSSLVAMDGLPLSVVEQAKGVLDDAIAGQMAALGNEPFSKIAPRILSDAVDKIPGLFKNLPDGALSKLTARLRNITGEWLIRQIRPALWHGWGKNDRVGWETTGGRALGYAADATAIAIGLVLLSGSSDSQALAAVGRGLEAVSPIMDLIEECVSIHKTARAGLKTVKTATHQTKAVGTAAAGLILDLGVVWGIFGYMCAQYGDTLTSIQFQTMLAEILAETMISVVLFILFVALSATVVGTIFAVFVEFLVIIFDTIMIALGLDDYTLTALLAKALYGYSLIAEPGVDIAGTDMAPDPERGLVAGSTLEFSAVITHTATHTDPMDIRAWPYFWYWTLPVDDTELEDRTVKTMLSSPVSETLTTALHEMRDEWQGPRDHHRFALSQLDQVWMTDTKVIRLPLEAAGINHGLPVYINQGYTVPAISCWTLPIPPFSVCYPEEEGVSGDKSVSFGESIVLDIFPGTLDEFYRLDWDAQFGIQRDHDGDGLLAGAHAGPDPNDHAWDADGDGLPDAFELEQRAKGGRAGSPSLLSPDSDGDGLSDDDEFRLGTLPSQRDSDGDGLSDAAEVFHRDADGGQWTGGWTYTYTFSNTQGITETRAVSVTSDPLVWDTDGDGLSDGVEQGMGTNPRAWTPNPQVIRVAIDDDDGILAPGQAVVYTATVENQVPQPPVWYLMGTMTTSLLGPPASAIAATSYNIGDAETMSHTVIKA